MSSIRWEFRVVVDRLENGSLYHSDVHRDEDKVRRFAEELAEFFVLRDVSVWVESRTVSDWEPNAEVYRQAGQGGGMTRASALQRGEAAAPRLCACGCGTELDERPNRRYATRACKTAAWKARTGYCLVGVQKASQTPKSRRSGRQVSYRKAVEALAGDYIAMGMLPSVAAQRAVRVLAPTLPERQR